MKTTLEVKSKAEGDAIKTGLDDAEMRALVVVRGTLAPLPQEMQQRVLDYIGGRLAAQRNGGA